MTTEIQTIQRDIQQFAGTIPATITSHAQMVESTGLFAAIRKKRKEVEKFFNDKFIDPAKTLLKGHQQEAKIALQPLVDAETMLNKAITAYRQQEAEQARKEQEKLNKAYEKKVERAVEKGKDIEQIAPPALVQAPASSTKTDDGQVIFRKVKKLTCLDEGITPDAFCIITRTPNKRMIEAALRAGQAVPGWRLDEVEELATR